MTNMERRMAAHEFAVDWQNHYFGMLTSNVHTVGSRAITATQRILSAIAFYDPHLPTRRRPALSKPSQPFRMLARAILTFRWLSSMMKSPCPWNFAGPTTKTTSIPCKLIASWEPSRQRVIA